MKNLIINYINTTLSPNIIEEYGSKNNINISNTDSIIIYKFIKRNYNFILNGDESSFIELKQEINPILYVKLYDLYMYYKSKLF